MKSDIEIAREAKPRPVTEIAAQLGIPPEHLVPYGHTKAKLALDYVESLRDRDNGKLVLVTAMSPTRAGEGKTTVAIGLAELLGESLTAIFADRLGLKRALIIGLIMAMLFYLLLPLAGFSLPAAMAGLFCIFLFFEFTIVTSFSLSTELMPEARATMMAGIYATAGIGRMLGVLAGAALWQLGGIWGVACASALFTGLGLVSLLWGLSGWQAGTEKT